MKRILGALVGIAFLGGMAVSGFAALPTQSWNITVKISSDPIDLEMVGDAAIGFGAVAVSTEHLSNNPDGKPRSTLQNNGYATIAYKAQVSAIAGGWGLGNDIDAIGADQFVLAAIFTYTTLVGENPYEDGRNLVKGDFGTEDVLKVIGTDIVATTDNLARNNALADPDDPDAFKGFSVPAASSLRSMRYFFQAPSSDTTAGAEQTITIIIGANAV